MPRGKDVLKWIEKYEKKLGVSFFDDWDIEYYPCIFMFDDGSFFTYTFIDDYLEIGPSSTNGKDGLRVATKIAEALKKTKIKAVTTRNTKAFERMFDCKCVNSKVINGRFLSCLEKEVD